jgi:hypothetical protein
MSFKTGRRHGAGLTLRYAFVAVLVAFASAMSAMASAKLLTHYEKFRAVEGLFDASGALQLPDGRIMIVQDTRSAPIVLLRSDGERLVAEPWTRETIATRSGGVIEGLSDLEEGALSDGFVYALASQGKPGADSFARFRIKDDRMTQASVFTGLKGAIRARHPALERAATAGSDPGFNLEGFTFDRNGARALLGFRAPSLDGKAAVVALDNPAELFKPGAVPRIGSLTLLDLDGDGIRGMAWLAKINGYLIAGRREKESAAGGKRPFRLWFWTGDAKTKPRAVAIEGLRSMGRLEGIAHVVINGEERILLVSDEGDREYGTPSEVALIAYERLRIAP